MIKNRNNLFIGILIIIGIIAVILSYILVNKRYESYLNTYNDTIYSIVGKIKERYPNITDEELIEILNGSEEYKNVGEEVLSRYGLTLDTEAILKLDDVHNRNVVYICIVTSIFVILVILLAFIYRYYQYRQINKIIEYIREINKKNYELQIKDNSEDSFSNLRNELYKITLMLREQTENSEKDKLRLADSLSDISHQIKTPLTSISIMLDELKENPNMDEVTKNKFIFEISRQVDHISFLIIVLLKLSKLDAGAIEFNNEKYFLDNLVKESINALEIPIEVKNINIVEKLVKTEITGDYKWTLEAVTNILKNCIEHTSEGKNIYITINDKNIFTELIIQDEGEGISEKDLKHIFERFYKGQNSDDNSFGIGLALAKSILERQNASITCISKVNEGTIFKIRWIKTK
jgi:signal transduction histidine kinase